MHYFPAGTVLSAGDFLIDRFVLHNFIYKVSWGGWCGRPWHGNSARLQPAWFAGKLIL